MHRWFTLYPPNFSFEIKNIQRLRISHALRFIHVSALQWNCFPFKFKSQNERFHFQCFWTHVVPIRKESDKSQWFWSCNPTIGLLKCPMALYQHFAWVFPKNSRAVRTVVWPWNFAKSLKLPPYRLISSKNRSISWKIEQRTQMAPRNKCYNFYLANDGDHFYLFFLLMMGVKRDFLRSINLSYSLWQRG